jgi:hypothetical protein
MIFNLMKNSHPFHYLLILHLMNLHKMMNLKLLAVYILVKVLKNLQSSLLFLMVNDVELMKW